MGFMLQVEYTRRPPGRRRWRPRHRICSCLVCKDIGKSWRPAIWQIYTNLYKTHKMEPIQSKMFTVHSPSESFRFSHLTNATTTRPTSVKPLPSAPYLFHVSTDQDFQQCGRRRNVPSPEQGTSQRTFSYLKAKSLKNIVWMRGILSLTWKFKRSFQKSSMICV